MTPRRTRYYRTQKGHIGRPVDLPLFSSRLGLPAVWLAALLASWALMWGTARAKAPAVEFRGLWIVRHDLTSPRQVVRAVDAAARMGFNAVMVQVRGRGDAFYRSRLVPRSEALDGQPADFDPLALAILEARRLGLEVHAWFNVFLTWGPTARRPRSEDHLLLRHPEWFMVSSDGVDMGRADLGDVDLVGRGVEGRYLSPGVAEVRARLAAVVSELVSSYDLDGVHLDYVRYPNRHYDRNPITTTAFVARYRFSPGDAEPAPVDSLSAVRSRLWATWRAEQVTETVKALHRAVVEVKPWVCLSAAVKPDPAAAYGQFGQDWARWVNSGLLDFVVPMCYVGSTDEVSAQVLTARGLVRTGHLYVGLGAYNQTVAETLSQVAAVRRLGVPGLVLYSYASLMETAGAARQLRAGPFAQSATVPGMAWKPKRGQGEAEAR